MYLALARKYRPQDFTEVIGQDPIIKTIANALELKRIHHAYLFCGARGVGKTSMARILAKSLNCENGPTLSPCQKCDSCESITRGNAMDVMEIDAASNTGVDNIRELREQVKYRPNTGRYKIFIIDEVHMLSASAFNALLKTLEEPPSHVLFILATTEPHEIPITILSRCLKFDFRKMNTATLVGHVQSILKQEGVSAEEGAVRVVADCAQGSVRDALSLLDQAIGAARGKITEAGVRQILGLGERLLTQRVFESLVLANLNVALSELAQVDEQGLDLKIFSEDLLGFYRHLILLKSTGKIPPELSQTEADFFAKLLDSCELSLLLAQYQILFQGIVDVTRTEFQKISLEVTFVKMAHAAQMIDMASLVADLKERREARSGSVASPKAALRQEGSGVGGAVTKQNVIPATNPASAGKTPVQDVALAVPGTVASDWYELVSWVKKTKAQLAAFLNDAVPLSYSDSRIEVGYPASSSSRRMAIERKQVVEEMFKSHFGKPVEFVVSEIAENEKKKP